MAEIKERWERQGAREHWKVEEIGPPEEIKMPPGAEWRDLVRGAVSAWVWAALGTLVGLGLLVGGGVVGRDSLLGIEKLEREKVATEELRFRLASFDVRQRPAMVFIPPGEFLMGSPAEEKYRDDDETQHRVKISRPFLLAETEVTQGQFAAVMNQNPSEYKDCGTDCPVEQVTWRDAIDFCNALSKQEGLNACYIGEGDNLKWNRACDGYRLPTEAEWEYAARGGHEGEVYVGTNKPEEACRFGNVADETAKRGGDPDTLPCDDGFKITSPVARFRPNARHLHDMMGNVREWIWDWFGNYEKDLSLDPSKSQNGGVRVIRGGSWLSGPRYARVANRGWGLPSLRLGDVGFRVARSLPSFLLPSHPLPAAARAEAAR